MNKRGNQFYVRKSPVFVLTQWSPLYENLFCDQESKSFCIEKENDFSVLLELCGVLKQADLNFAGVTDVCLTNANAIEWLQVTF